MWSHLSSMKGTLTCSALSLASVPYVLDGCLLPAQDLLCHMLRRDSQVPATCYIQEVVSWVLVWIVKSVPIVYPLHKGHLAGLPFFWKRSHSGECYLAPLLSQRVSWEFWRSKIVTRSREQLWQDPEAWKCNLIWFARGVTIRQIIIME